MNSQSSSDTTSGAITGTTSGVNSGFAPTPANGGDAVDLLLQDHQQIKSLLDRLTSAVAADEQQRVLDQLKELLTIHNATEENFVYPAIAKVAGHQHESEHLYHETAEADMLVFELDTALKTDDLSGFENHVKKLQSAVLEHIDDEEQKAFPHLREAASPEQAELLTRSVQKFRSSLKFQKA